MSVINLEEIPLLVVDADSVPTPAITALVEVSDDGKAANHGDAALRGKNYTGKYTNSKLTMIATFVS